METLDPVAFCFLLQLWGLCGRIIYQSLMAWGPLGEFEYIVPHVTQEAPQMYMNKPGVMVHLAPFALASASEDVWKEMLQRVRMALF